VAGRVIKEFVSAFLGAFCAEQKGLREPGDEPRTVGTQRAHFVARIHVVEQIGSGPGKRQVLDAIGSVPVFGLTPKLDEQSRLFAVINLRNNATKQNHAGRDRSAGVPPAGSDTVPVAKSAAVSRTGADAAGRRVNPQPGRPRYVISGDAVLARF
jgi:hypothetical protein